MDVSIITWDENYYDSCYEDYLQIMKNNEIVMIQSIQWFDNKNGILKDAF